MTTVNVSQNLLRKVIAHFADSIHEFREAETAPDGSIEIESQEIIESEERLLAELRQALASAEQPSRDEQETIRCSVYGCGDEHDEICVSCDRTFCCAHVTYYPDEDDPTCYECCEKFHPEIAPIHPAAPRQMKAEQPSDFDAFQSAFSEWAFATFKGQTVEAKLRHAIKEIGEIIDKPGDIDEWGDLFMLFCNASKLQGFTLTEIQEAARAKWQNDLVHREWLPPDEDGCVHHVKAEQPSEGDVGLVFRCNCAATPPTMPVYRDRHLPSCPLFATTPPQEVVTGGLMTVKQADAILSPYLCNLKGNLPGEVKIAITTLQDALQQRGEICWVILDKDESLPLEARFMGAERCKHDAHAKINELLGAGLDDYKNAVVRPAYLAPPANDEAEALRSFKVEHKDWCEKETRFTCQCGAKNNAIASDAACPHCNPCRHTEKMLAAEAAMRNLASTVSAGGFNDMNFDPENFEAKIRDGIDVLIRVERQRANDEAVRLLAETARKAEIFLHWLTHATDGELTVDSVAGGDAIQRELDERLAPFTTHNAQEGKDNG